VETPNLKGTVNNTGSLGFANKPRSPSTEITIGGAEKLDLDQNKRVTVAKQTPWSPKEMGI
jgi:DNA-binding transcriptional regulator/RsmH inhibitor MraZ